MSDNHITMDLAIDGHRVATVEVPLALKAGKVSDGLVPITPDLDDLNTRIKLGVEAFQRAVC